MRNWLSYISAARCLSKRHLSKQTKNSKPAYKLACGLQIVSIFKTPLADLAHAQPISTRQAKALRLIGALRPSKQARHAIMS